MLLLIYAMLAFSAAAIDSDIDTTAPLMLFSLRHCFPRLIRSAARYAADSRCL